MKHVQRVGQEAVVGLKGLRGAKETRLQLLKTDFDTEALKQFVTLQMNEEEAVENLTKVFKDDFLASEIEIFRNCVETMKKNMGRMAEAKTVNMIRGCIQRDSLVIGNLHEDCAYLLEALGYDK